MRKQKQNVPSKGIQSHITHLKPVTHEQIARRAHEIFVARGSQPGRDLEDWFLAERELNAGGDQTDTI